LFKKKRKSKARTIEATGLGGIVYRYYRYNNLDHIKLKNEAINQYIQKHNSE